MYVKVRTAEKEKKIFFLNINLKFLKVIFEIVGTLITYCVLLIKKIFAGRQ